MRADNDGRRRLDGWKAIATALNRDESTVKRWQANKGLPVHRVGGHKGASVYAWSDEIDRWLGNNPAQQQIEPETVPEASFTEMATPEPSPQAFRSRLGRYPGIVLSSIGASVVFGCALLLYTGSQGRSAVSGYSGPQISQQVSELLARGVYLRERRTPDSLREAADTLKRATELAPDFAEAHAALATTYNLMAEYRVLPAKEGYEKSQEAAYRAIALNQDLAEPYSVLGDIAFFWLRDYETGLDYFHRAIAADPAHAQTRHWYGSALIAMGRYREALVEIDRAAEIDPTSRSIRVSKGIAMMASGQAEVAEHELRNLLKHEPTYRSPYRFLAFATLAQGDFAGYLDAWKSRFRLLDDQAGTEIILVGEENLERGGPDAMARAMLERARHLPSDSGADPYFLAHIFALGGDWEKAREQLHAIDTRHSLYYGFDPAFQAARQDPGFREEIYAMGFPVLD